MRHVDGIPLHQIPRDIVEEAGKAISDFVVGFVALRGAEVDMRAELGGSGTLVQVEGSYGILTAHHVLQHLPDAPEIGLILPTRFQPMLHRFVLRREAVRRLKVARGDRDSEGPDLGVLLLSEVDAGALRAWKTFYNLARHRQAVLDSPGALDEGVWLMCGFAGELTEQHGPDRGYEKMMVFRGECGAGWVEREYAVGDFDYFDFEARYGGVDEPPKTFGGFSGAGLWQARLTQTPQGALSVQQPILSGVAFYESCLAEGRRTIKCHARRSVYSHVLDAVRNTAF
jgi:hypothetical protein